MKGDFIFDYRRANLFYKGILKARDVANSINDNKDLSEAVKWLNKRKD